MLASILLTGVASTLVSAKSTCGSPSFDNLVTFGDSYTDSGRLGYYIGHNGTGPPPGVYPTESNKTASGGLSWGQYIARSTGANYRNYAVSGAVCSNKISPRLFASIGLPFPAVVEDELPSFESDVAFKTLYPDRTAENTVYALWIGTNDLGYGAFLTDSQVPGKTLNDYLECIWSVFDSIYQAGGRRLVLLNVAPLQVVPLYTLPVEGGTGDSQFWANKTQYNIAEYNDKIRREVEFVNSHFNLEAKSQVEVQRRWPKATLDILDVHALLTKIHKTPEKYLDAPYNATGYFHHCPVSGSPCVDQTALGPASGFMWYDELHPSARVHEIIAKEFLKLSGRRQSKVTDSSS